MRTARRATKPAGPPTPKFPPIEIILTPSTTTTKKALVVSGGGLAGGPRVTPPSTQHGNAHTDTVDYA
jgi:hypothetical protein